MSITYELPITILLHLIVSFCDLSRCAINIKNQYKLLANLIHIQGIIRRTSDLNLNLRQILKNMYICNLLNQLHKFTRNDQCCAGVEQCLYDAPNQRAIVLVLRMMLNFFCFRNISNHCALKSRCWSLVGVKHTT